MFNLFKNLKKPKKTERKFIKYNEDDILEILTEYLAEKEGFETFQSRAIFFGPPGKDLRLIGVIDELESELTDINLEKIDESMDYNGDHHDLPEQFHL